MSHFSQRPIENKSSTTTKILANAQITKAKTKTTATTATSSKAKTSTSEKIKIGGTAKESVTITITSCKKPSSKSLQPTELVSSSVSLEPKQILPAEKEEAATHIFCPQHHQLTKPSTFIDRKHRRKHKNPRSCSSDTEKIETDDSKPMLKTDVEVFQGKIVFNLDGNAFIIATENSTQDLIASAKTTAGSSLVTTNEVGRKITAPSNSTSATTKSTNKTSTTSATSKEVSSSRDDEHKTTPKSTNILKTTASPRIHSFRIVSAQYASAAVVATTTATTIKSTTDEQTEFGTYVDQQPQKPQHRRRHSNSSDTDNDNDSDRTNGYNIVQRSSKIQKPILMCFICKLSFGNTKSFSSHASSEHQLTLQPKEQHLLNREYSSAIIQPPNMDESPQISFLEPIDMLNVIKSDDLNTETDVQFNEGTTQAVTFGSNAREVSERSVVERIMSEKADDAAATTDTKSSIRPLTSGSTSPSTSAPMSPDLSLSSIASPKSLRTAPTAAAPPAASPSQITSTLELPSAIDSSNNSHLLIKTSLSNIQQQRYEAVAFVTEASAMTTPTLSSQLAESTKLNTIEQQSRRQQQQQQTTIITNRLKENAAVEMKDIDDSKAKLTAFSPSLTSSAGEKSLSSTTLSSSILPKNESEKSSNTETKYGTYSLATSQAVLGSSSDCALKPRITVCVTPTTASTANNNSDLLSNPGSRSLQGANASDCHSPPLTAVTKVEAENTEMGAAPTSASGFQHMQLQCDTDSDRKLDRADTLSRLSADAVNFLQQQQQQQQYSAMSSSTFATPPTSLMSMTHTHSNLSCLHSSLVALTDGTSAICSSTEAQKTNAKLISDFLQQHISLQQQYAAVSGSCAEHTDYKDNDCKNCEMQQLKSPPFHNSSQQHVITSTNTTPQRSPTRSNSSCTSTNIQSPANLTTSPNTTAVSAAAVAAAAQQQNAAAAVAVAAAAAAAAAASVASNTSSFTIGACSDHINGRPLGVECTRCEMILSSTRLNTGVQMSTRNSCKTLKCPQCNWHYKYQETLEIHMREKHPDGESACGYCLSGQQHPRLARGESYSCGYKPYRCEICNYSTTTKGNLSIHMQSDKHLNNMQELNSSQNMLAAAVAVASSGKTDVASKLLLTNNIAAAQQQQQSQAQQTLTQSQPQQPQSSIGCNSAIVGSGGSSGNGSGRNSVDASGNACGILNKSKPSFRCDICSYETSVARNLRIHMTSEKHTHNMAALQNNIKHIQAYSFLQQHQQAVAAAAAQQQHQQLTAASQAASQLPALGSGLASGFIPEIALADLAYNQALMIQLLQHNAAAVSQQQSQQQQPHESVTKLKTSPTSSPRPMQVEQSTTLPQQQQLQQQQQIQQLRQQLQQSYSPNSGSPTLLLSTDPFTTSDINLSSSVSGGCSGDETLEPPVRADPCPTSLYTCLVCDFFSSNSLDELNQHLLIDRSRNNSMTTNASIAASGSSSNVNSSVNTDIMVILNNNYICRLCNYKTNLKANFQLHSKTDKHLQKLNYINHIREGGPQNEYKLKYLQLAANTVQLKCNCCDFYTNSIQKLSLHTQQMRHETMRMIFQHLLHIMQHNNFEKTKIQQHSKSAGETVSSIREPHGGNIARDNTTGDTQGSANTATDMAKTTEKSLTCQLCNYSAFTLLNMIQHVKSLRHMQVEQFVSLQRRSEQLDPPSLDDVFKVVEQPILQALPLSAAASPEDNKMENIRSVSVADYFPVPTTRLTNEDTGYNTPGIDHNSFSPSSNSSVASGNTSVRSKGYQRVNTPNFQSSIGDRYLQATSLGSTTSAASIPSVVFKCNNCDLFAQSKDEMEIHLGTVHPQTEPDYISIPTNSAAMQAFQAAVAAATAAAASAVTATRSECKSNLETDTVDDDCPTSIKRERLFSPVDEELEKGTDMSSTMTLKDTSTIDPWITTTMNENTSSPSMNESGPGSHNVMSGELVETEEEELHPHSSLLKSVEHGASDVEDNSQVGQTSPKHSVQCPLCTDIFGRKQALESHLMNVHSVNRDGLARLLQLVDASVWKQFPTKPGSIYDAKSTKPATGTYTPNDPNIKSSTELSTSAMGISNSAAINLNKSNPTTYAQSLETGNSSELSCEQCSSQFKHEQQLLQHAQKTQHFVLLPNGDHRCLAASHPSRPCHSTFPSQTAMIAHYKNTHISLVISERHVYKYRCKHCSLAFKTQEKLSTHLLYHTMRDATKCTLCQRNFRSTQALQKHMDQTHHTSSDQNTPSSSSPTFSSCSGRGSPSQQSSHGKTCTHTADLLPENAVKISDTEERQSPPGSPQVKEVIESKISNTSSQVSSSPLGAHLLQEQQQQQEQVAAITAALLNQSTQQQAQPHFSGDELSAITPTHLMQHMQIKPCGSLLTQKYIQQHHQSLQNLQQLQQLPQLTATAASSGLQLNPVEMLNLMQFHHIMSMNFMNLAPPLIFGVGANAGVGSNSDLITSPHTPKVSHTSNPSSLLCGSDLTVPATPVPVGPTPDNVGTISQQQQPQQQQQAVATTTSQMVSNQKRARTRITDDQLKILRAHFDINNSPSEESIMEMSQKANLPMKVVKHWFRNTLFKERQRNKDSPYNFNNPPSTTLNLEEYERTGQAKVTPLNEDLHLTSLNLSQQQREQDKHRLLEHKLQDAKNEPNTDAFPSKSGHSPILIDIKTEPFDENVEHHSTVADNSPSQQQQKQQRQGNQDKHLLNTASTLLLHQRQQRISTLTAAEHQHQQVTEMQEHTTVGAAVASMLQQQHLQSQSNQSAHQQQQQQHINLYSYETKSESGSSDILSRPQSPNSTSTAPTHYASINEILNQQLDNLPLSQKLTSMNVANLHGNNMGPPKNFQTNKSFEKNSPSSQFDTNSNSSNASSTSSGKRANRTRFTDYQIKNARQKQRKIYENQPNNSLYETEEKKHNINYACKKCNLAFQRYYELIRHQKNHCFKEENNKKSAKAQIAAAQIAQNLSSEDSNSSMDINSGNTIALLQHQHVAAVTSSHGLTSGANISSNSPDASSSGLNVLHNTSPQHLFGKSSMSITDFSPSTTPTPPQSQRERTDCTELQSQVQVDKSKFECDKCKIQFGFYEHFREHQLLHLMNPGLFTSQIPNIPDAYGSFGSIFQSLQQVAAANATHQQQQQLLQQQGQPPAKKRKCSETSSIGDDMSSIGGTGDTDINPVSSSLSTAKKFDFLYQYFMQNESNNELKQQFQSQHQQSHEPELEMEFLANFYHQSEVRKRSNYDFLYEYYQKHERKQLGTMQHIAGAFGTENKPHIDFLLQYYQLNESKKFFQLDASNPQINDHTAASPTSTKQYQRTNNISLNRDNTTTPKADCSMSDSSLTKNSMDALSSNIEPSDADDGNNDNDRNSNGGMDVDDADSSADTDNNDDNNDENSFCARRLHTAKSNVKISKQTDLSDNSTKNISTDQKLLTNLPFAYNDDQHLKDVSKARGAYVKNQRHNHAKRNSSSLSPQSQLPLTAKAAATVTASCNSGLYMHNLKEFLDETPTHAQTCNEILAQTDTDGSSGCTAIYKMQSSETSSSSPNSNTNNISAAGPTASVASKAATGVTEKQQSKRLRTTILPEQLNFLYECYQKESNPSRKMLEEIAKKVNLKKRVVQVWFQNSRAKDKKSRNQRFATISDDSNYEDATQYNKDGVVSQKNVMKTSKSNGSKAIINVNINPGLELSDFNLCQLPQVNIQQHAIEHFSKMKKLLEQTKANVNANVNSEVDAVSRKDFNPAAEAELTRLLTNGAAKNGDSAMNEKLDRIETNGTQESNFSDADIVASDHLCTFTRVYKELSLQNAMKQALESQRNNNCNELDWRENRNRNDGSAEPKINNQDVMQVRDQRQIFIPISPETGNLKKNAKEEQTNSEIIILNNRSSVSGSRSAEGGLDHGSDHYHYNNRSNFVNRKLLDDTCCIGESDHSRKSANCIRNTPLSTSLTDDGDKDSSDRNTPYFNVNTHAIQNRSIRNESITANCSSSSTSSAITATTALTNLSNSHAKDIIKQLFNCSQITAILFKAYRTNEPKIVQLEIKKRIHRHRDFLLVKYVHTYICMYVHRPHVSF
ncbi:zinc finger protein 2 isoform X4 [Rhagoletis pomonella]|uniref:zinc finger protein 2 isoform X4 n=2 Tax=Rhagoletis TaxID=28609 RepID=UPI0017823001|nr:zinc finger protein 2 isoform X4 [Rhagoletis pomonella]